MVSNAMEGGNNRISVAILICGLMKTPTEKNHVTGNRNMEDIELDFSTNKLFSRLRDCVTAYLTDLGAD